MPRLPADTGLTHAEPARGGLLRHVPDDGCGTAVRWLLCLAGEVPASDADSPPGFLSDRESEMFAQLRFAKRRREWLLGRWTAKRLYQCSQETDQALPMCAITVANDSDGAPYLLANGKGRLPLSLSISHRQDRAFCALAPSSGCAVGADVERVELRDPAFVHDFFTSSEGALVSGCPAPRRDTFVTILWSAKEAVLKAMRYGLRVDTRRVEIGHLAGLNLVRAPGISLGDKMPEAWWRLQVSTAWPERAHIAAWCAVGGDYVYTLAVATPFCSDSQNPTPVL